MWMNEAFWRVFNYLALQWYDLEVGKVEEKDRHYQRAMDFMSLVAARHAMAHLGREDEDNGNLDFSMGHRKRDRRIGSLD